MAHSSFKKKHRNDRKDSNSPLMEEPFAINTGNRFHHLSLLSEALIREQVIFSTKALLVEMHTTNKKPILLEKRWETEEDKGG